MTVTPSRVGVVATHLNGIDLVSLQSSQWCRALTELGHECFFFSGDSMQPEARSVIVPEAGLHHPDIEAINHDLYENCSRTSKTSGMIQALRFHIKQHLRQFIQTFDIGFLIVENALSLPLNIPLGLALTELIAETRIPTIIRHHGFVWEQARYWDSPADDYIHNRFPPRLPSVEHVVASRFHADQMAMRYGIRAQIVPYSRDFQQPSTTEILKPADFNKSLGIDENGSLFLSTAPIVASAQIEQAIAFIARIEEPAALLVTGDPSHSEQGYLQFIQETAELMHVPLHLIGDRLLQDTNSHKKEIPSMAQCFQQTTAVVAMDETMGVYAEIIDAIYHRKPVLTSRHNPLAREFNNRDIKLLRLEAFPSRSSVHDLQMKLEDPEFVAAMTDHNFMLGEQYYSLQALAHRLEHILHEDLTSRSN
jgi:hypothetical protein